MHFSPVTVNDSTVLKISSFPKLLKSMIHCTFQSFLSKNVPFQFFSEEMQHFSGTNRAGHRLVVLHFLSTWGPHACHADEPAKTNPGINSLRLGSWKHLCDRDSHAQVYWVLSKKIPSRKWEIQDCIVGESSLKWSCNSGLSPPHRGIWEPGWCDRVVQNWSIWQIFLPLQWLMIRHALSTEPEI